MNRLRFLLSVAAAGFVNGWSWLENAVGEVKDTLANALGHLRSANRISGTNQSYRKDNPSEYAAVMAYLDGGARPSPATAMGKGLIEVEDARRQASEIVIPSPIPGLLSWAPPGYPSYAGYEQRTVTNAQPLPSATPGTNRDVVVTIGEPLTGPLNLYGWRNAVLIGGAWNMAQNVQLNRCLRVGACTGTVHLEGLDMGKMSVYLDAAMGVASGPGSATSGARVQIQNCRIASAYQANIGSGTHDDCIQNWDAPGDPAGYAGGARGYRFDRCTFIPGYQGIFMGNHSGGATPQPIGDEDSFISNSNFVSAVGFRSPSPIFYWKSWRVDPWGHHTVVYFTNVYIDRFTEGASIIPNKNGGGTTIAGADAADRGYTLKSDAAGSYIEWLATSDQQGIIRIGAPPDGDFCPAGVPGMGYVSPGYA